MTKNPKFAFQASQNLKPCFDYLINKRGLKLVNIGPQDIFNGVHKLTLALIFQIIIAVQIDNIEVDGLKGQHGLLLWVNRQIEPYGQHVTDFKESWRNGLAFAALAAALCDGYNFPAAEGMDQNTRHASAYQKIEDDLKVAKLLDPEDFQIEEIDDKSVLTYVSTIFNAVASGDESRRHIQAIDKVAQLAMKHGTLIIKVFCCWHSSSLVRARGESVREGSRREGELLQEHGAQGVGLHFALNCSGKECRKLIKELEEYKKVEKVDMKTKKTDIEGMLEDIHESERAESRPMYIPPEGLGPNEISQKYRDVEEAEDDYEERLLRKFKYFLEIEQLMNQLDRKCQRLNDRLANNVSSIDLNDLGRNVAECQQRLSA